MTGIRFYNLSRLSSHFDRSLREHVYLKVPVDARPDLSPLREERVSHLALDASGWYSTRMEPGQIARDAFMETLEELATLKSIRSLILNWSAPEFPEPLIRFHNLQHLALHNLNLVSLPGDLGRLNRLRSLFINSYDLVGLPKRIGGLKHLRELFLNTHRLARLPKSISQLAELRTFALRINDRYLYIDWGKAVYVHSKWEQPVEEILELLSALPSLQ